MAHRTVRTQFTLLYAVPFLISGVALLSIPLLASNETEPADPAVVPHATDEAGPVVRQVFVGSAIGLAVLVLLSFGLGWVIAGRFLRPLRAITATARDISASNLHRRLDVGRRADEFTELGETLNDLFGRLEASFESQRRFVANASHELRTPLTAERALLQVALAHPDATVASLRSTCEELLTLGAQQERLIDALLTLASSERGVERPAAFDLADVARTVVATRRSEAERRDVRLVADLAPAPATGDPSLAESLVANLIDNAVRHNVPGGRVDIRTGAPGEFSISNTGPVIPADQVGRLFEPFQQLGRDRIRHGGGHGLGLAIVHAIARAHGAALTARARPGGGLDVTVRFPGPG